jgi:hypothetical protein
MHEGVSSATQSVSSTREGREPSNGAHHPLALAAISGLFTGVLLAGALQYQAPAALGLEKVAQGDLDEAISSMDPKQSSAAAEDARTCRVPLAFVTIAAPDQSQPPKMIRIRSGGYVTPPLIVTSSPRRIALPFPAPYPAGRGVISVEGAIRGLSISLIPSWQAASPEVRTEINVTWTPKAAC